MALPSKCDVDQLVSGLVEAAGSYSDTADLDGHVARAEIISKAKDLIRAVVSPIMAPNYHGLNVSDVTDQPFLPFSLKASGATIRSYPCRPMLSVLMPCTIYMSMI